MQETWLARRVTDARPFRGSGPTKALASVPVSPSTKRRRRLAGWLLDHHQVLILEANDELERRARGWPRGRRCRRYRWNFVARTRQIALVGPLPVDSNLPFLEQATRAFAPQAGHQRNDHLVEALTHVSTFDPKLPFLHLPAMYLSWAPVQLLAVATLPGHRRKHLPAHRRNVVRSPRRPFLVS